MAYQGLDDARVAGTVAAVTRLAGRDHPTGLLMPLAGLGAFLGWGPSRLHALALNFAAYALLQVAVVLILHRLAGWPSAILGWGLTWALRTVYLPAGGAADFRSDFFALCLYAVCLGCALRGRALESRGWALLAGLAAAACVWARFLTIVYLAGTLGVFALARLVRARRASEEERPSARARARGAALAIAVTLALSAPALWVQRAHIAAHYFRGILGPLRTARAQAVGADRPLANLAFYPHSLLGHAGPILAALAIGLAVALVLDRLRGRPWSEAARAGALLTALAFAVPLLTLTALTSKSIVVGGILAAPLLWAIPLAAARVWPRGDAGTGRALMLAAACCVALAGATVQWRAWRVRPFPVPRAEVDGVLALHDAVGRESRARGISAPVVSVDHVSDALNGLTIDVTTYERTGAWLGTQPGLGSRVGSIDPAEALAQVRASDFVILTVHGPGTPGPYPVDRSLDAARPALLAYCERAMRPVGRFRAPGREVVLFTRREEPAS